MKLTEVKTHDRHYFRNERDDAQGEAKEWHHNKQLLCHCLYKDDIEYGECKLWDENGNLILWWLLSDEGNEVLRFDRDTGFEGAEEQVTKLGNELNLPILKDIPVDRNDEAMLMWELKHPNMPLLSISETV